VCLFYQRHIAASFLAYEHTMDELIKNKNFCAIPFTRQTLWYDGSYRLCCYTGGENISQEQNNKKSFNSDQLKNIRTEFLNGKYPKECHECKNLSDNGLASPNMHETSTWISNEKRQQGLIKNILEFSQGKEILPHMLDLRLSNVCNLKCRPCNPSTSSAIQAEYNAHLQNDDIKKFHVGTIKQKYDHNIDDVVGELFRIYFAGGEPLIEQYNLNFLETYRNLDTEIIINTNLTVVNDRIIQILSKFKNVIVMVSLDGIAAVNDYIRYGSKFENIIENIRTVNKLENVRIYVNFVLSMYNVFDIRNFFQYFETNFPDIFSRISISPVCTEKELFLECMPRELREPAINVLKSCLGFTTHNQYVLQDSIKILEQDNFNQTEFNNFIKYSLASDKIRNQSLVLVIPQYSPYVYA
jgi:sulfatase maturation enzyme AslB (radical SAM superfamily)